MARRPRNASSAWYLPLCCAVIALHSPASKRRNPTRAAEILVDTAQLLVISIAGRGRRELRHGGIRKQLPDQSRDGACAQNDGRIGGLAIDALTRRIGPATPLVSGSANDAHAYARGKIGTELKIGKETALNSCEFTTFGIESTRNSPTRQLVEKTRHVSANDISIGC